MIWKLFPAPVKGKKLRRNKERARFCCCERREGITKKIEEKREIRGIKPEGEGKEGRRNV